jgi:hypothetical protein
VPDKIALTGIAIHYIIPSKKSIMKATLRPETAHGISII